MKILVITAAAALSGCTALQSVPELAEITDKAAQEMAEAMDKYCVTVPPSERTAGREMINSYSKIGATGKITCPGDK